MFEKIDSAYYKVPKEVLAQIPSEKHWELIEVYDCLNVLHAASLECSKVAQRVTVLSALTFATVLHFELFAAAQTWPVWFPLIALPLICGVVAWLIWRFTVVRDDIIYEEYLLAQRIKRGSLQLMCALITQRDPRAVYRRSAWKMMYELL